MAASSVKLSSGHSMPVIGLGTWQSKPGEVEQAVKYAIDAGYHHIDCAHIYGNEPEVGAALKAKIAEGVVSRKDLFITSKLWNTFHRPDLVLPAVKTTLANLGLDYLDLYLIHWPVAFKEGGELFPRDENSKVQFSDVDYVDTWKAMEKLVSAGLVRSIGVSNFNRNQLQRVLDAATVKPVTNQVECHPYLNQNKLRAFCKQHDILITAYSPLGNPGSSMALPGLPKVIEEEQLKALATKYKKSVAQVILRYLIQVGTVPIPKSVTKSRIEENINIFDFELSPEDVASIDKLDKGIRTCPFNDCKDAKYYPFNDDY